MPGAEMRGIRVDSPGAVIVANTLATRKQSEAIRDRMQVIRCRLPYRADAAREHVRQLADWKHHFAQRPWPVLGLSAALGYLAVPGPHKERVVVQSSSHQPEQNGPVAKKGLMGGLFGALGMMALRMGVSIATKHVSEALVSGHSTQR